jgi:hypothetical protein
MLKLKTTVLQQHEEERGEREHELRQHVCKELDVVTKPHASERHGCTL